MAELAAWLERIGLGKYADAFAEAAIDLDVLPDLSEADLEGLGLKLGDRKRLLKALAAREDVEAARAEHRPLPSAAERRQLTVMFVDLVGSTELSRRLDPEDLGEVMRAYHGRTSEVIQRWGGHVAKYLGDGVLAYFGWPQAHEDDAERAVRAGLALTETIGKADDGTGKKLAVRVGIATGPVVVGELIGEGDAQEKTVVGETPNLAARLQAVAAAGTVMIANTTRALLGELFELADLGTLDLKGFDRPVPAFAISGERPAQSRFEARSGSALLPMVGRDQELALLLDRWAQVVAGAGQAVLLSGEAGVGKSRIARALRDAVAGEPHTRLGFQCSPHRTGSALHPFVQQLADAAGLQAGDPDRVAVDKVKGLLARGSDDLDRAVPLIAELLSLPSSECYPRLDLSPAQRKHATFEVLLQQLEALAADGPVLIVFEDMHWADPTSQELWDLVIARMTTLPILAVVTCRPGPNWAWLDHGHVASLSLNRLGRRHAAAMIAQLCGDGELPSRLVEQILERADGNPLYLEELTKTLLDRAIRESQDGSSASSDLPVIPVTLQDSLLARLDLLSKAKEVAQLGAAIGRTFDLGLISAVAALDEAVLAHALDQLVGSGIVHLRKTGPESSYTFKHALMRDAAYESLLKSKRRDYHRRIARALQERSPAFVENEPEVVAYHLSEAGLAGEAAAHWYRAGRRALDISAYREAIEHLERARTLLTSLSSDPERDRRELDVRLALGAAWIAAKAYSADEVRQAYGAAVDLSRRVGDAARRFAALRGLWNNHLMRVELPTARELALKLRSAATDSGDPDHQLAAERAMGTVLLALGEHHEANACFWRGIRLYEPERHQHYVRLYGEDPGLWCYGYAAWTDDWLGLRDRALEQNRRAVEIARGQPTPNMLAMALSNAALLHQYRRDFGATLESADETIEIADRLGVVQFRAWASIHRGWALACSGRTDDGLTEIEAALATWRAIGGLNNRTHFLNLLSECCRLAGRFEGGMAALDEADGLSASHNLHAHDAETHRRRGQLFLAMGELAAAEGAWRRAIQVARRQRARTLELRAIVDLVGLQLDQSRPEEADALLGPAYAALGEGFDTWDFKDARALLDQLA